jgi:hypothetical protein
MGEAKASPILFAITENETFRYADIPPIGG